MLGQLSNGPNCGIPGIGAIVLMEQPECIGGGDTF